MDTSPAARESWHRNGWSEIVTANVRPHGFGDAIFVACCMGCTKKDESRRPGEELIAGFSLHDEQSRMRSVGIIPACPGVR